MRNNLTNKYNFSNMTILYIPTETVSKWETHAIRICKIRTGVIKDMQHLNKTKINETKASSGWACCSSRQLTLTIHLQAASSAHFMLKEQVALKESNFTARVKVKSSNGKNVGEGESPYPLPSFCSLMNTTARLIKVSSMNILFLCKLSGA